MSHNHGTCDNLKGNSPTIDISALDISDNISILSDSILCDQSKSESESDDTWDDAVAILMEYCEMHGDFS